MERKCAIYNRISVENKTQLEKMKNTLIEYCQNILDINDYVLFEDVGSVEGKRKKIEDMIDRIHKEEFTDLLVYHPNRIYRAEYNKEKFDNIINDIDKYVTLHSVDLKYEYSPVIDKYLEVLKKENEYFEKYIKNKTDFSASYENPIEAKINSEILDFLNNSFIWRKIKTKLDMYYAMNSKYKYDLLKLGDYYHDELWEIFAKFYNIKDYSEIEEEKIEELFSIENFKKLLESTDTPVRIKDCINLYLECDKVCDELYHNVYMEKK